MVPSSMTCKEPAMGRRRQKAKSQNAKGWGTARATVAGNRRIPMPMVLPRATATPNPTPTTRARGLWESIDPWGGMGGLVSGPRNGISLQSSGSGRASSAHRQPAPVPPRKFRRGPPRPGAWVISSPRKRTENTRRRRPASTAGRPMQSQHMKTHGRPGFIAHPRIGNCARWDPHRASHPRLPSGTTRLRIQEGARHEPRAAVRSGDQFQCRRSTDRVDRNPRS